MVRKGHRLRAALCAVARACGGAGVRRLCAARARHDRRIGRGGVGRERAYRRVGGSYTVSAVFARAADLCRGRSDLHGEQCVFRSEDLQKARVSAAAVRGDDVLRRVCLRPARRRGRGGELPDGAAAVRARRDERPRALVDGRQGKGGPPLRAAFHPARRADGRVLVRNGGRLCAGAHPLDAGGAALRVRARERVRHSSGAVHRAWNGPRRGGKQLCSCGVVCVFRGAGERHGAGKPRGLGAVVRDEHPVLCPADERARGARAALRGAGGDALIPADPVAVPARQAPLQR